MERNALLVRLKAMLYINPTCHGEPIILRRTTSNLPCDALQIDPGLDQANQMCASLRVGPESPNPVRFSGIIITFSKKVGSLVGLVGPVGRQ
mmetsp:Transcript_15360/g.31158  ORF Transcript_15360/g.31158 Transcript_15360/m.31158 type:complete len:92 (+) Transcript_15360:1235-1510(+)